MYLTYTWNTKLLSVCREIARLCDTSVFNFLKNSILFSRVAAFKKIPTSSLKLDILWFLKKFYNTHLMGVKWYFIAILILIFPSVYVMLNIFSCTYYCPFVSAHLFNVWWNGKCTYNTCIVKYGGIIEEKHLSVWAVSWTSCFFHGTPFWFERMTGRLWFI